MRFRLACHIRGSRTFFHQLRCLLVANFTNHHHLMGRFTSSTFNRFKSTVNIIPSATIRISMHLWCYLYKLRCVQHNYIVLERRPLFISSLIITFQVPHDYSPAPPLFGRSSSSLGSKLLFLECFFPPACFESYPRSLAVGLALEPFISHVLSHLALAIHTTWMAPCDSNRL